MSKRFVALKKEFKCHGLKMNNRDIRHYLHNRERMLKITQRFKRSVHNARTRNSNEILF